MAKDCYSNKTSVIVNYCCPYCANQKVFKGFNDFLTANPDLAKEWDYEKNELKPDEVTANSHTVVWWICKNKHHYRSSLANRTKGQGCYFYKTDVIVAFRNIKRYQSIEEIINNLDISPTTDYTKDSPLSDFVSRRI